MPGSCFERTHCLAGTREFIAALQVLLDGTYDLCECSYPLPCQHLQCVDLTLGLSHQVGQYAWVARGSASAVPDRITAVEIVQSWAAANFHTMQGAGLNAGSVQDVFRSVP